MKNYTIEYRLHIADDVHTYTTRAKNKEDAYVQATFYEIPYMTGEQPYSTWVEGVTYKNGKHIRFNTHEGKPY